jgi:hypothetical protein
MDLVHDRGQGALAFLVQAEGHAEMVRAAAEADPADLRLEPHARGRPSEAHLDRDPGLGAGRQRVTRDTGSAEAEVGEVGAETPDAVDDVAGRDEGLDPRRLALVTARHHSSVMTMPSASSSPSTDDGSPSRLTTPTTR